MKIEDLLEDNKEPKCYMVLNLFKKYL